MCCSSSIPAVPRSYLLGGDKSGRWEEWYRTAIPDADRLYDEYVEELRADGLL